MNTIIIDKIEDVADVDPIQMDRPLVTRDGAMLVTMNTQGASPQAVVGKIYQDVLKLLTPESLEGNLYISRGNLKEQDGVYTFNSVVGITGVKDLHLKLLEINPVLESIQEVTSEPVIDPTDSALPEVPVSIEGCEDHPETEAVSYPPADPAPEDPAPADPAPEITPL